MAICKSSPEALAMKSTLHAFVWAIASCEGFKEQRQNKIAVDEKISRIHWMKIPKQKVKALEKQQGAQIERPTYSGGQGNGLTPATTWSPTPPIFAPGK
mmetsp:Transcript_13640/g.24711  ORF Transcript_13640/g.24711 Transcript_13640/m.24711 type:complete len:99 (+) Transcript_13640:1138-1434(+)